MSFLIAYMFRGGHDSGESSGGWKPEQNFTHPSIDYDFTNPGVLFRNSHIYYTPSDDSITEQIMKAVKQSSISIDITPIANETYLNQLLQSIASNRNKSYNNQSYGVIFDANELKNNRLKYTLRMIGYSMTNYVNRLFPVKYYPGPASDPFPYTDYFCPIQLLINNAFADRLKPNDKKLDLLSFKAFRYPFPKYKDGGNTDQVFSRQDMIAFGIIIGYVILCPLIVKRITDEKATKAKEMLKMIGMSDWVFWGSHFISYFIVMLLQSVIFVLFYCIGLGGDPLIYYSDDFLFFAILVIYSAQSIMFCMTITTVFNRPVLAVVVTVVVWIVSYAAPIGILNPMFHENMDVFGSNPSRVATALFLPNMGLAWSLSILGQFEVLGVGANWSSLYRQTPLYGSLTLGIVMLLMLISCFMYGILIWYLDNVWPFQYGVPKPIYFPFTSSYWFPSKHHDIEDRNKTPNNDVVIDTRNFDKEPESVVTIGIKNLRKEFGGYKVAVDDLSLNIYDRQITVLLGHNGAGKTTTMNMITGIYGSTSGTIHVDGYNIKTETNKARRSIGLCPQV